jgi:hypothetical protein
LPARQRARRAGGALALVALASLCGAVARADSGDGPAAVLSEGEVGTLQGPTYTTQILRGQRELLLVTRETGAGAPRDAYLFGKSVAGWTRVAQLASKERSIEGAIQGDAVVLYGERGQALMQIKLDELRLPETPAPPAADAPPAQPPAADPPAEPPKT